MFEKIVVVTRKTRLEELIERFNTRGQARFYIEHAGGDYAEYEAEDGAYRRSLDEVRRALDGVGPKLQLVDRGFLPTFLFTAEDLVVTLGQDGLVANTAKYVGAQPIVAVNPDPQRFDGVLLPFSPAQAQAAVGRVLTGKAKARGVTMAEVRLTDGQKLLAFNDLYIGSQTHVSSRYRIGWGGKAEPQSSSGVLVSTGAGSTGWLSSVCNMAAGITALFALPCAEGEGEGRGAFGKPQGGKLRLEWEDPRLVFVVREPFVSRHSQAQLISGLVAPGQALELESLMPSGGVIFSDGVEADYLAFNSGAIARIGAAQHKAQLVAC